MKVKHFKHDRMSFINYSINKIIIAKDKPKDEAITQDPPRCSSHGILFNSTTSLDD